MTRPSVRWRVLACGIALAVGLTACTTSSADDPGTSPSGTTASASVVDPSAGTSSTDVTSPPVSPTPSVIDVPSPSSQPPVSLDPEAQEIADRAAVEAAWSAFWSVNNNLIRTPESERAKEAAQVAVDPSLSQMLADASRFSSEGIDYYGTLVFHPYWEQSINGQPTAVMGDCTDTSGAGSLEVATQKKRTVGVPDNNTRVTFVKDSAGEWRVSEIFYLVDIKC